MEISNSSSRFARWVSTTELHRKGMQGKVLISCTGRALPKLERQTCLCHLSSLLHLNEGQHLGHKALQAQGRPLSVARGCCRLVHLQCEEL